MLHRWAGFKCSRSEQTEFIGGCHTKAVSFAMFWESCVCLFFNAHLSGNQCFIYVGNELGNYIRLYLTFPSPLFQGVKKVHYKKKFQTSSCCWASTFYSSSDVNGLILLFTSGKIQIRWRVFLTCIFQVSWINFRCVRSHCCHTTCAHLSMDKIFNSTSIWI